MVLMVERRAEEGHTAQLGPGVERAKEKLLGEGHCAGIDMQAAYDEKPLVLWCLGA